MRQPIYREILNTNGISMIDDLKKLKPTSMLTIDDESSLQLTGNADLTVTRVFQYDYDGTCIIFVECDSNYLIVHNLLGETKCFICEEYDSGE